MKKPTPLRKNSQLKAFGNAASRGFTLIEILVTVALIALLTAIAVPAYSQYKIHGQTARKSMIIDAVAAAKSAYLFDPATTVAQQAAFDSSGDVARLALLEITVNNARVTTIDQLVVNTGETSMTIGDSSTAPTIP